VLVVARVDAANRRVAIDALAPWGSSRDPQDCSLAAASLGGRLVLEERQSESGTCDNPSEMVILRAIVGTQLVTLAELEVDGRVGPCGDPEPCPWRAKHETELEYGAELRLTTTVTWSREKEAGCRRAGPSKRTIRRTLRFVGDRLVDPQRPGAKETPSVEIGDPPG
jgi:hypothetical protein